MTQREFDGLPGLLTRKVFLAATGLHGRDLRRMRRTGELKVFTRKWRTVGEWKGRKRQPAPLYYKSEAARITGFKL